MSGANLKAIAVCALVLFAVAWLAYQLGVIAGTGL